jgi:hypothetical protein
MDSAGWDRSCRPPRRYDFREHQIDFALGEGARRGRRVRDAGHFKTELNPSITRSYGSFLPNDAKRGGGVIVALITKGVRIYPTLFKIREAPDTT